MEATDGPQTGPLGILGVYLDPFLDVLPSGHALESVSRFKCAPSILFLELQTLLNVEGTWKLARRDPLAERSSSQCDD